MTDELPTVWPLEPHTLVKHQILRKYLDAWLPILTQQGLILKRQFGNLNAREILFIDGFAGPGQYANGEPGSPVIAVEAAITHQYRFPMPVRMLFIEHRQDRFDHLQKVLAPVLQRANANPNLRAAVPELGDCDTVLNSMLDEFEKKSVKFGPALAFLDQFGYGAVSMDLIKRILSYPQCEVFTYLSYNDMNRWITDPHKWPAFTRAFGSEDWKECIPYSEAKRRERLLAIYKSALKTRGGAKYVVSFFMFDSTGKPLYWLLFCTSNIRGLEVMKKAMWAVDKSGTFRFSDKDNPNQLRLLDDEYTPAWLAEELRAKLGGRTMTVPEVQEFVLVETPCHLFKSALALLEKSKHMVVGGTAIRRSGQYPDPMWGQMTLRFVEKELF